MSQTDPSSSVSVERPTKADRRAVCELLNCVCRGTWDFDGVTIRWFGRLRGEPCDPKYFFVGKIAGSIVSASCGFFDRTRRLAAIQRACAAPHAPPLASLPPLLACIHALKENGAGRIVVAHWHDRPYAQLRGRIEKAGFRWEDKSVYFRNDLTDLPNWPVPTGYAIRSYRDGDEKTWADLRAAIFGRRPRPEEFLQQKYLGLDMKSDLDPDAFLFAEKDGGPVGLCGGIIAHKRPKVHGRHVGIIGWTGVLADHRGKGLGKALVAAALRRVTGQGAGVCEVETQPYRKGAVRLYQTAGFRFQQASLIVY